MKEIRREEKGGGYFGLCTVGGILSAGTTHVVVTPLDVLKVNMQVHSLFFNSLFILFCLVGVLIHSLATKIDSVSLILF